MQSKPVKAFLIILFVYLLGWVIEAPVFAAEENSFVSVVHPVRGRELWEKTFGPDPLSLQIQLAQERKLPVTWLLAYDALLDKKTLDLLQSRNKVDEVGIFMEVTDQLAEDADVERGFGEWYWANKVFLSGYNHEERVRLIDTVFERFRTVFGVNPSSIGAWHLDAYSLEYIRRKYKVITALVVADQLTTDGYGLWGQYWSTPFYPAKTNALMPANSAENKLDIVVTQWAARDPVNAYGGGVVESTYSVQANDYASKLHKLDIEYFEKLADLYTDPKENDFAHLVVGLETGGSVRLYNTEYKNQLDYVADGVSKGEFKAVTLSEFGSWYREQFPDLSPPHRIDTDDLLGTERKVTWYMTPWYRVGILYTNEGTKVVDWRVYDNSIYERYFWVKNPNMVLDTAVPALVDSVRPVGEPIQVSEQKVEAEFSPKEVLFENGFKLKAEVKSNLWLYLLGGFYLFVLAAIFFVSRRNYWLMLILVSGVAVWSLTTIKSGLIYEFGMGFWGPHGHDGIWHIALGNSLIQRALQMPVFAGEIIQNYHLGFDLMLALLHKMTQVSVISLYFQVIPPLIAFMVGFLTYKLVFKWRKSHWQAFFAAFFVYFGGSWGWVITLLRNNIIGGETLFWSNQGISTLINPPYALSLVVMLVGLYLYFLLLEKPSRLKLLLLIVIFSLLIQIKVYAGMVILAGLGCVALYTARKTAFRMHLLLLLGTLGGSVLLFLPTGILVQNLIVFSPFWFIENLIASYDRLYWTKLANAMAVYKVTDNWVKFIAGEFLGLAIFFIGNIGTRIIGVISLWSWFSKRKVDLFEVLFVGMLLVSGTIPLFFIQKGTAWNTIQFFYYFLFFFSLLAGIALGEFIEKTKSKRFKVIRVIAIVVILTLPTAYGTLREYLGKNSPARLSFEELDGLEFLQKQPDGTVLTFPYEWKRRLRSDITYPLPLGIYETTAYVSAFSDKKVHLEDEMNLTITGYDWEERKKAVFDFFTAKKAQKARKFLEKENISYIYLVREQGLSQGEGALGVKKIFDNPEVRIYKVL